MRIEDYFQEIRSAIEACSLIRSCSTTYDKRSTYSGLIRGELYFVDGSVLYLREFVDVETAEARLMYSCQYMDCEMRQIFRYDNAGHHKGLNLASYPHHKHLAGGHVVAVSPVPTLADRRMPEAFSQGPCAEARCVLNKGGSLPVRFRCAREIAATESIRSSR